MSLQGTTQAYEPMASTYIALAPECGDKLFGSDINYCDLVQWGIFDGQENDPRVLAKYKQQRGGLLKSFQKAAQPAVEYEINPSTTLTSVWSLLSSLPQLSTFKKIVERSDWYQYINNANELYKVTVFAPNNNAFKNTVFNNDTSIEGWNKTKLKLIAQAHTLPFAFEQTAAYGRKLRLYTSLDAFSVYIDGTAEVTPGLSFYSPQNYDLLSFRYPKPFTRVNIVQGYYTNNGALYEVDGIFEPQVILY